jgi:hypothetical protein
MRLLVTLIIGFTVVLIYKSLKAKKQKDYGRKAKLHESLFIAWILKFIPE